jgi:hypothetical protein
VDFGITPPSPPYRHRAAGTADCPAVDFAKSDTAIADVLKGLQDRTTAAGEAHLQTAGHLTARHD